MQLIKKMMSMFLRWANDYNAEWLRTKHHFPASVSFYNASFDGTVIIGENTYINDYSRIDSGENSKVTIGRNCAIGRFVHITSKTHDLTQPTTDIDRPVLKTTEADVLIGNCVWIGDKVTVLPGVTIGDYAVIAAHCVVNKNVQPFEIVGGIPMRHIRFNTEHEKFDSQKNNVI